MARHPLHKAAEHSESPEVIKVLLDAGANPKAKARYDYTPWFLIQGHLEKSPFPHRESLLVHANPLHY